MESGARLNLGLFHVMSRIRPAHVCPYPFSRVQLTFVRPVWERARPALRQYTLSDLSGRLFILHYNKMSTNTRCLERSAVYQAGLSSLKMLCISLSNFYGNES